MKYTYIKRFIAFCLSFCASISLFGVATTFAEGKDVKAEFLAYGVDVSSWQGKIDWEKVKDDGKSFAILRAGTTKGKDTYFEENYKNAKAAEIYVGCYYYTYAKTVEEAEKDAEILLSWLDGKQLEYPVYYDMENEVQLGSGMTTALRTQMCMAFIEKMEENGWYVGTYANANWYSNYLNKETLGKTNELWLASWTNSGEPSKNYRDEYGLWQYSSTGKVSGISTGVDLDVSYKDYPNIMQNGGYNGYSYDIEEVNEEWIITSSDGVNVRKGPGILFAKTGFLKQNDRIHVTAKVKDSKYTWGRIGINGVVSWCVLDYAIQTKSELVSKNVFVNIKDNVISGLNLGEEIYDEMFNVSGLADMQIKQTKFGFGTGTTVNLILGDTIVDTYYVLMVGDINGDCVSDAYDLTHSLALTNFETDYEEGSVQFLASDINKDGVCDVYDTNLLAEMVNMEQL